MASRNYIGLACTFHEPALAIVDADGEVVFAEASERHLQNKRGFHARPDDQVRIGTLINQHCDPAAELVLAKTWSRSMPLQSSFAKRALLASKRLLTLPGAFRSDPERRAYDRFAREFTEGQAAFCDALGFAIRSAGESVKVHSAHYLGDFDNPVVERSYAHHLTHAATACYSSPFDDGVCVIVDGVGELGSSVSVFEYRGGRIRRARGVPRSYASLGAYYLELCAACGFDPMRGEEWKVMGLAPYGKFDADYAQLLRELVGIRGLRVEVSRSMPRLVESKRRLIALRQMFVDKPWEAADLAHTGQEIFAEIMTTLLRGVHALGISDRLILGGGCALNSSYNGRILAETGFEKLHVYAAPADDGNAVGAALLAYDDDHPKRRPQRKLLSPYLGSTASTVTMDHLRRLGRIPNHESCPGRVAQRTAELLADGKLVGWFQGRAEFGPRALGNRSILADPRSSDVKDRINAVVKFREEFRPFAPAILHEFGDEYFEDYQESPYMERTARFRPEAAARVPGVVHVDGTGRLQTVKREWNPRFHELIAAFADITGVPVLLNTSFNVMGKPIVHSVEDAVAVFFTTGLDALVIGDDVIVG